MTIMIKYQDALIHQVLHQLELWLEGGSSVSSEELHRFLHTIKGSAGTLGLERLAAIAGALLQELVRKPPRSSGWTPGALRSFLLELITQVYSHGTNGTVLLPDSEEDADAADTEKPLMLILDDDIPLLLYLKEQIEARGWVVVATRSPEKAISYFHNLSPDCFMLDYHLPDTDGLQVMGALTDMIRKRMSSTIMISIDQARETRLNAFRMGADDFFNKPIDLEELFLKLERKLERKKWIDRALFVDELTGAYNRKYLAEQFCRLMQEYERSNHTFSLAVLDLDHFKNVNDSYGHLMGDHVLMAFARYMKENLRPSDIFCRYGGEEFVVLLAQTGSGEAARMLDRLRAGFADTTPGGTDGPHVTMSAGVMEYAGDDPSLKHALELADLALYRAKEEGRNRVRIADGESARTVQPQLRIAVVDDDALIRAVLAESLTRWLGGSAHAEVRTFASGDAFLADRWQRQEGSCLVILDGMMPGADGLEVLERLRSRPDTDRFLVIMLTGRDGHADRQRALELGADDYVTKPYSLPDLENRILRLVRQLG